MKENIPGGAENNFTFNLKHAIITVNGVQVFSCDILPCFMDDVHDILLYIHLSIQIFQKRFYG